MSFRGGVLCRIWEAIHQHRTRGGGGGGDGRGGGAGEGSRQHEASPESSTTDSKPDSVQDPPPSATQEGEPT